MPECSHRVAGVHINYSCFVSFFHVPVAFARVVLFVFLLFSLAYIARRYCILYVSRPTVSKEQTNQATD